jgi:transposase
MTTIRPHLSIAELEQGYRTATEPIAKSHFHALWLLSRGYDIDETAGLLSFSTRWVRILIKRYNEGGPSQLGDQRADNGTEPTILTPDALGKLKQRLQTPPDDGGVWTGPKIARWLAQYHGLASVHDQRGWDALIAIGWSIQQPRPRHPQTASAPDRSRLKKTAASRRR